VGLETEAVVAELSVASSNDRSSLTEVVYWT